MPGGEKTVLSVQPDPDGAIGRFVVCRYGHRQNVRRRVRREPRPPATPVVRLPWPTEIAPGGPAEIRSAPRSSGPALQPGSVGSIVPQLADDFAFAHSSACHHALCRDGHWPRGAWRRSACLAAAGSRPQPTATAAEAGRAGAANGPGTRPVHPSSSCENAPSGRPRSNRGRRSKTIGSWPWPPTR